MSKLEKILNILGIVIIILITIGVIWFVKETKEMLNDHRCYELPLKDFFKDEKCKKYWRYKK